MVRISREVAVSHCPAHVAGVYRSPVCGEGGSGRTSEVVAVTSTAVASAVFSLAPMLIRRR